MVYKRVYFYTLHAKLSEWNLSTIRQRATRIGASMESTSTKRQGVWNDPRALLIELNYKEEKRFGLIARLEGSQKLWIAIFTTRSAKIRIISVRRARADESEQYEQEQSEDS
jgi:uncharacterized protein